MKEVVLRRESPRLRKHKICGVDDENNRCTRSMKKKVRDISTVPLDLRNSFKGNISNVEDGDDILKVDDDSDFEVSREKKKCKVAVEMKSENITVGDGSIYVCSRFLKVILSGEYFIEDTVRSPGWRRSIYRLGIEGVGMAAYRKSTATANGLRDTNSGARVFYFSGCIFYFPHKLRFYQLYY
ncbi:hypothetical protein OROMI_020524 [Orobanche minor]